MSENPDDVSQFLNFQNFRAANPDAGFLEILLGFVNHTQIFYNTSDAKHMGRLLISVGHLINCSGMVVFAYDQCPELEPKEPEGEYVTIPIDLIQKRLSEITIHILTLDVRDGLADDDPEILKLFSLITEAQRLAKEKTCKEGENMDLYRKLCAQWKIRQVLDKITLKLNDWGFYEFYPDDLGIVLEGMGSSFGFTTSGEFIILE